MKTQSRVLSFVFVMAICVPSAVISCGPDNGSTVTTAPSSSSTTLLSLLSSSASASASADAEPPDMPQRPAPFASAIGPVASGAASSDRENALISLFAGMSSAGRFPIVATDPSAEFDPALRARLQKAFPEGGVHGQKPLKVRLGEPAIGGPQSKDIVTRIVRQNIARIRACYQHASQSRPDLAGRVVVRFVVNTDGSVKDVGNGGSDLPDETVVKCVMNLFRGMMFPEGDKISTVTFPITFATE